MDPNPFRTQSPYPQNGQQYTGFNQAQNNQNQQGYGYTNTYQAQPNYTGNPSQLGTGSFTGNQPMSGYASSPYTPTSSMSPSFQGSTMMQNSTPTGYSSTSYGQSMPQPQTYGMNNMQTMPNATGYSSMDYQMPTPQTQYGQQQNMQYGNNYTDMSNQYGGGGYGMGTNMGGGGYYQQQPQNPDNFLIPDVGPFSSTAPSSQARPAANRPPPPRSDGKVRKINCPVCHQEVEGDEPAINYHVNNHLDDAATEAYKQKKAQPQVQLTDAQLANKLYVEDANSRYRW
ncbi:hypothetical protein INT43_000701 [Umbelopsis isabellina]|uniref:Uncharacterized protein n=1 Tax=Mortierella isabellina TaxID=91625 RepID=A0A8H7Q2M7_MORIS|nr:hypothetical protein INT43_000701 [Umbelopsis isabellina]